MPKKAPPLTLARLRAMQKRSGRGRPRQTIGQRDAREAPVFRMMDEIARRGVKRGDWVELQRRVYQRHGIASSEFYKILSRWRYWQRTWMEPLRLIERELSPREREARRDRPFADVLRLARRRAARKR